jgi:hypothetical protein
MKILFTTCLLFAFNVFAQSFSVDPNFQANISASTGAKAINSMIQLANKSWVIGGSFNNYNGNTVSNCVLADENGAFIRSFPVNGVVNKVDTSKTGNIIIAGVFTTYNSNSFGRIIKIDSLGNVAPGWVDAGINNTITDVKVLPNDSMVIVGNFIHIDTCCRVARLTPFGIIDTSYHTYPGVPYSASTYVFKAAIQSSGKVVIAGYFTQYNGVNTNSIVRLNVDGSFDNSFIIGTGPLVGSTATSITSIAQLGDTLFIGGNFTNYNGTLIGRLAKLYPDGTVDPTFASNIGATGFGSTVSAIYPVTNGLVLVGGAFTIYKGVSYIRLVLLNADGTVDNNFVNTGSTNGLNGSLTTVPNIYVDKQNSVYVCIAQTSGPKFNNVACNYGIRLSNGLGTLPVKLIHFNATRNDNAINLSWQTASEINNSGFEVQRSFDGKAFDKLDFVKGNGTTNVLSTYKFIDNDRPLTGADRLSGAERLLSGVEVYYRLKQFDENGKFTYSNIVEVSLSANKNEVSISPNPFTDFITLSQPCDVEIMNEKGVSVLTQNQAQLIETTHLPAGIYIIKTSTSQSVKHSKLVKY